MHPSQRLLILYALICAARAAPLTLAEAVRAAGEKYPAVRVSLEQVSAAAAGIDLARTGYLPRADLLGQVNRATRNNTFGLLMPQSTLPSISGPVLGTNGLTNVWGSAVGFLVSWEPFDFGLRKANVEAAETSRRRAETAVARTRLEVATAVADAFLTVLAAGETVKAAESGVRRARVLEQTVDVLVKAGLRPGVDAARMRAEAALASTQSIQARQAAAVARATLGQFLGLPAREIVVEPGRLLEEPGALDESGAKAAGHPLAREQSAAIEESQARLKSLERAYFPRFNLQASSYARGTGANPDGTTGGALTGLGPNVQNWAAGMTVTFPALEFPSLRARRQIETHRARGEQARYDQLLRDLAGQRERAQAALEAARLTARETPVRLEAARATEQQATARYQAGLGTLVEVAEAQRLLAQAEIDDGLAQLGIWRALLGLASAQGDLEPFLARSGR